MRKIDLDAVVDEKGLAIAGEFAQKCVFDGLGIAVGDDRFDGQPVLWRVLMTEISLAPINDM